MSPGMGGYSSISGAVSKMAREEGIRGFYKGLYPNLLKVKHPKLPIVPSNCRPSLISFSSTLHASLLLQ